MQRILDLHGSKMYDTYGYIVLFKMGKVSPVKFLQRWSKLLWEAKSFNFAASIQIRITKLLDRRTTTTDTQTKDNKEALRLSVCG